MKVFEILPPNFDFRPIVQQPRIECPLYSAIPEISALSIEIGGAHHIRECGGFFFIAL